MDNMTDEMIERRTDVRLKLRMPILLFWAESENPVQSETVDISSRGFYCTTKEPFAPGDRLRCLLSLPVPRDSVESELYLDGEIEVMRVLVDNATPGFGLGCRIADYRLVNKQTAQKWPLER